MPFSLSPLFYSVKMQITLSISNHKEPACPLGPEVFHHFQPTMDNPSENFLAGNCSKHLQHFQIPPTTFCSLRVTTKNLNSALFHSQKNHSHGHKESGWVQELKMLVPLPPNHGFDLGSSFHITIFCVETRISWVLLKRFPSFCTCLSKSCITQLLPWSQEAKATTLICDSWPSCGCCLWWSGKILLIFACILREKYLKEGGTQETCSTLSPLLRDPLPNASQITTEPKFVSGTGKYKAWVALLDHKIE